MIDFLERYKFLALTVVVLSAPAFAFFSLGPLLFCDAGPVSTCLRWAGFFLAIPVIQIASLTTAWILHRKQRCLSLSTALMALSVAPALFWVYLFFRR
ncbi:MAG: hypothetical protein ABR907_04155 [Terracidiphilus sp.]|jgi:hypothetical protein